LEEAGASFLPVASESYGALDVLALSCTSFALTIGRKVSADLLRRGYVGDMHGRDPPVACTDMAQGIQDAARTVLLTNASSSARVFNVVLLTPYMDALHEASMEFLHKTFEGEQHSIRFVVDHNLGLPTDCLASAVAPSFLREQICSMVEQARMTLAKDEKTPEQSGQVDLVVIQCSALRATGLNFLDDLEKTARVPCISSNSSMMWHCLWQAAQAPGSKLQPEEIRRITGYGSLFRKK
jgi:maleate cis-trans isomerase